MFHPIIYIVSNYMDSEKDSFLQGFKSQVICTDNKNSSVCENSRYFQQLQGKTTSSCWETPWETSLWLMGFPSVEGILKIGFLNDKVEEQQKHNTDSCDIVLEKDQTLDVVNSLLQHILHCGYWREMEVSWVCRHGPGAAGHGEKGASPRSHPSGSTAPPCEYREESRVVQLLSPCPSLISQHLL